MAYNRELSQFASLVEVNDTSKNIGISTNINVSGVVTATNFYGSGRFLTDIISTQSPAGTEKQLQYNNGSTVGGAKVYYDSTTENLGIGTSTPSSKLYVVGDGYFTGIITASNFYKGSNPFITSVGVSSNGTVVSTGITQFNFINASVTSIGQTANISVGGNITLTIGRRDTTAAVIIGIGTGIPFTLRDNSVVILSS